MNIKREQLEVDGIKCIAQSFNPKKGPVNYYTYLEDNSNRSFACRYKTESGWKVSTSHLSSYNAHKHHKEFPDDVTHETALKWAIDAIKEYYPERFQAILNPEYTISFNEKEWRLIVRGLDIAFDEGAIGSHEIKPILNKIKEHCNGAVHDALINELNKV